MATNEGLVKIKIKLPPSDWHNYGAETQRTTPKKERKNRIENSPFFVDEISYQDVVLAVADEGSAVPIVRGVTKRSGNSTYRILLGDNATHEQFGEFIKFATDLGCTYQALQQHQYSLNVPAGVAVAAIAAGLQQYADENVWVFEASHIYMPD